jgi:hypothetical protein
MYNNLCLFCSLEPVEQCEVANLGEIPKINPFQPMTLQKFENNSARVRK